jgi:hypothetical protein
MRLNGKLSCCPLARQVVLYRSEEPPITWHTRNAINLFNIITTEYMLLSIASTGYTILSIVDNRISHSISRTMSDLPIYLLAPSITTLSKLKLRLKFSGCHANNALVNSSAT